MENLKSTILRSGFPLEMEIDNILNQMDMSTFPSFSYIDSDLGKPREIDDIALFPMEDSTEEQLVPLGVSPNVIVECKRLGDYSAIVFRRGGKTVTQYDFEGQMSDFPQLIEHRPATSRPWDEFDLGWFLTSVGFHYNDFAGRIGTCKAMKPTSKPVEEAARDDIHDGVMQLIKARSYDAEQSVRRDKSITNPYYPLFFSFLVLVVDGAVIEVESSGSSIVLHPVDHAVVKSGYKPPYSDRILNYLIDVVNRSYFQKYIRIITDDYNKLCSRVISDKPRVQDYLRRMTPESIHHDL